MFGVLDVHVKKQQNTWSSYKQWIRGDDKALLEECYAIYQKWGLQSVVVAMTAMEHVFAQDTKKMLIINQVVLKVEEWRKMLKKSEADDISNLKTSATDARRGVEITKEMIFERIEKNTSAERESRCGFG